MLPDSQKERGDVVVEWEEQPVYRQIIVEFQREEIMVNLYVEHQEFPHIVPESPGECDISNGGSPSTVSDLPSNEGEYPDFEDEMEQVVEEVGKRYNVKETDEPRTCSTCIPQADGPEIIVFNTRLK